VTKYIFELVLKSVDEDQDAKNEFIEIYKSKFPQNSHFYNNPSFENMNIMFVQLMQEKIKIK